MSIQEELGDSLDWSTPSSYPPLLVYLLGKYKFTTLALVSSLPQACQILTASSPSYKSQTFYELVSIIITSTIYLLTFLQRHLPVSALSIATHLLREIPKQAWMGGYNP